MLKPTPAARSIVEIAIDQLHDSPFNPPDRARLHIDELAANIAAEGRVHQPLLVRPLPSGYEIVFGHRRRYAAQAAGLATVPCEVRDMSDAEVRSAQAAENVQRENLQALEEAAQWPPTAPRPPPMQAQIPRARPASDERGANRLCRQPHPRLASSRARARRAAPHAVLQRRNLRRLQEGARRSAGGRGTAKAQG